MRIFAALILSLLILLQTFSSWLVIADFQANRDYIAKNLCVNRYRPELNCNGQCVLMKKLAAIEEKQSRSDESKNPVAIKAKPVEILYCSDLQTFQLSSFITAQVRLHSKANELNGTSPVSDIFHPPRIS